ncbi:hypothetical protein KUH03_06740 [Sphingobacterium sp. E70]|nr:hypothetical protein [Sphingobacterium sp. E70]ULT26549.1 hypothetical protein KUH03_06740 [Sphingobacterium sp. E70]
MLVDVAVRQNEKTVGRDYYVEAVIEDIGDLQDFHGYIDIDVEGLQFIPAKIHSDQLLLFGELTSSFVESLLKQGYGTIVVSDSLAQIRLHSFPIQVRSDANFLADSCLRLGGDAHFFIGSEKELQYALINGYLINLKQSIDNKSKNVVK